MMDQRTLDIIYICKKNTKYWENVRPEHDLYDAIRNYMADKCMYKAEWYTDKDISDILYEAAIDYLDNCDKPSFFMRNLREVMERHKCDICYAMALTFNCYVQVRNDNGYINGFDDRLHRLDKEEFK